MIKKVIYALLLAPSVANADVTLIYMDGQISNTVKIHDGKLQASSMRDANRYVLFDSATRVLTVLDRSNKKFTRIDEQSVQQLGSAVSAIQVQLSEQVEAQLKNMSPEQQAQMRQMMGGLLPPDSGHNAAPVLKSRVTQARTSIGDWTCQIVEVYKGDQKASEACIADYPDLGIGESDYAVIKASLDFVKSISGKMPQISQASLNEIEIGEDKLPIRIIAYQPSGTEGTMLLNRVSHDDLNDWDFSVPTDYTEQNLMEMMPR